MKTIIIKFSFCFLILSGFNCFAENTTISVNYPAPSGAYNKVVLITTTNPQCNAMTNGVYTNAGELFLDTVSHTLQMCTADGTAASVPYPEACFNRFCSWTDTDNSSPPKGNCSVNQCPYGYSYGLDTGGSILGDKFTTSSFFNAFLGQTEYYHTKSMLCCTCRTPACLVSDGGATVNHPQ